MKRFVVLLFMMSSLFPLSLLSQTFITNDKQMIKDFNEMLKEAQRGNGTAQHYVGERYLENKIVKADTIRAIYWMQKAGQQDQKDAVAFLAEYFYDEEKWEEALLWNLRLEQLYHSYPPSSIEKGYFSFEKDYFDSLGRLAQLYKTDNDKRFHYLKLYVNHNRNINDFWNGEWYDALAACYRYGLGTRINKDLADKWNAIGAISEGEDSVKLLELKYSKENEEYVFWNAIREEFKDLLLSENSQQSILLYDWLLSLSKQETSYSALQKLLELTSTSDLTDMEQYLIFMSLREHYKNNNASREELAYVEAKLDRYRPQPYPRFKMNSWIIKVLIELVNKNY